MQHNEVAVHVGTILNAGYIVRHYPRPLQRAQRAQALITLGLAVRAAFNASDDFEPLLRAIVDALAPFDNPRF